MTIRPYQNNDYKQILRMLNQSMDYHMNIADPPVFKESKNRGKLIANFLRSLVAKTRRSTGVLLVAEESPRELSGFVYGEMPKYSEDATSIRKRCGTVKEIYVADNYRNKGIGVKLMKEIEDLFIKNNCDLVLLNDVHRKNTPAINLYEKLGYHVRVSEYVKDLKN